MPEPDASGAPAESSGPRREEVGGHTILSELGRGGMGVVYLAGETDLEREVALKMIGPGLTRRLDDPKDLAVYLARFGEEARVTGQLQHPGVIPIYRMGEDAEGRRFYTMRPVTEGRTLKEVLLALETDNPETAKRWNLRHLVEILRNVCLTLAYAHNRGVVHRDLKPSNIVLGDYGEVLVIDWGLAKVCDAPVPGKGEEREDDGQVRSPAAHGISEFDTVRKSNGEVQLTLAGEVLGTPAYMAPEQARGEVDGISPAADIYALGVILYEILTLTPPFMGESVMALLELVRAGDYEDPTDRAPDRDIPEDLALIARTAMSLEPEGRYESAREMADALGAWLDGVSRWKVEDRLDFHAPDARDRLASVGSSRRRASVRDGVLQLASGESTLIYDRRFAGDIRMSCTAWCSGGTPTELSLILCASDPEQIRISGEDGYCFQFGGKPTPCFNLARHQEDVLQVPGIAPETGKKYRLTAEISGGEASFSVDGEEIARWRDPAPLHGGYVGFYGYGKGARFSDVVVETLGKPTRVSILETPDAFYNEGLYDKALEMYREVSESHPRRMEGIRAAYKAGLCMLKMGDIAGARTAFQLMQQKPQALPFGVLGQVHVLEQEQDEAVAAEFLLSWARNTSMPSPRWMEAALYAFERARAHASDSSGSSYAYSLYAVERPRAGAPGRGQPDLFDKWFEAALRLAGDRKELAARASPRYFGRLLRQWASGHMTLAPDADALLESEDLTLARLTGQVFWAGFEADASTILSGGWRLQSEGRLSAAHGVFQMVLREFSDDNELCHSAMRALGQKWVETLNFNRGLECYDRAVREFSLPVARMAETQEAAATACWSAGRFDEAFERFLEIAESRSSRQAAARRSAVSAGLVLLDKDDFDAAFEHFRRVPGMVRRHKTTATIATAYAVLALRLAGRDQEAQELYQRWREEHGGAGMLSLHDRLEGIILRSRGRFEDAIERFGVVVEQRPAWKGESAQSLVEIAETHLQMGRPDEAWQALVRCLKDYEDSWSDAALARLMQAHVLRMKEETREAHERYEALSSEAPPHPTAAPEAALWAGLMALQQYPNERGFDCEHFRRVALAPPQSSETDRTARNWWAIALLGDPVNGVPDPGWEDLFQGCGITGWTSTEGGLWLADEDGVAVTPGEALRRSGPFVRRRFMDMLRFRSEFDPSWERLGDVPGLL